MVTTITDLRRSNTAHNLHSTLPIPLRRHIRKRNIIIKEVILALESLETSVYQDFINKQKAFRLSKLINPIGRNRFFGPIDSSATMRLKSNQLRKCPPGTRRNPLGQCIKIR